MVVFRIAKRAYVDDLSGTGARLYGGRWNHQSAAMVYASESRALATVEYLVHLPAAYAPSDPSLATLDIPDDIVPDEIGVADLPANWRSFPAPSQLADLGTSWALERRGLLLRVPSAAVDEECNILINPAHQDMARVAVTDVVAYAFDERLLR